MTTSNEENEKNSVNRSFFGSFECSCYINIYNSRFGDIDNKANPKWGHLVGFLSSREESRLFCFVWERHTFFLPIVHILLVGLQQFTVCCLALFPIYGLRKAVRMRTELHSTEVRNVTFAQSSAPDAQTGPNFLILVDLQLSPTVGRAWCSTTGTRSYCLNSPTFSYIKQLLL